MEEIKHNNNVISYNIGHKITGQQKEKTNNLLLGNHNVFATDISESRQTMGLETLSSDFEGDPKDELIEEPIELLMISTCEVRESILVTKEIDPLVQVVTLELNNTQSADITIDPIPYSPYNPFQEKVKKTRQKLIQSAHYRSHQKKLLIYAYYLGELLQGAPLLAERLLATQSISDYYKRVSIRVYDLFSTYGIEAIYHTSMLNMMMIN
ncbi:4581_t:CDS:2 [Gigaspora margarita]|uniref:4581_t:CDS:1 n=1 Tax=Gigaspora margarita TaxID=4874 RepID=A0ABN7UVE4_GIGMA|nr:4581_t:CDS:2 [Gigaspora margarita]